MRKLPIALVLSTALGCGGETAPPADDLREPPDALQRTVETYAFAVTQRDYGAYVSVLAEEVETANDSGACIDWLESAFWASDESAVCGARLASLEVVATNERLLQESAVEVTTSASIRRDTDEVAGAFSGFVITFTLTPVGEKFKIERVHVQAPYSAGT